MEEDWRGAGRYKALKVRVPKNIAWGRWGEAIKEPVVVKGSDIQMIVVKDNNLENYVMRRPDTGFYQITQAGIYACWWQSEDEGRNLVKEELDSTLATGLKMKPSSNHKPDKGSDKKRQGALPPSDGGHGK